VPYKAKNGYARLMVNFTVRARSRTAWRTSSQRATKNFAKTGKNAADVNPAYALLKHLSDRCGSTWTALSIGEECPECFTTTKRNAPFPFQTFQLPATVPFASYDYGGESVGYHDLSAFNVFGDNYRSGPDYVDIPLENGKPVVGQFDAGLDAVQRHQGSLLRQGLLDVSRADAGQPEGRQWHDRLDGVVDLHVHPPDCWTATRCRAAARPYAPWRGSRCRRRGRGSGTQDTAAVPVSLTCGVTYRMRATFPEPYYNIESAASRIAVECGDDAALPTPRATEREGMRFLFCDVLCILLVCFAAACLCGGHAEASS
jgi:hypothetical protein